MAIVDYINGKPQINVVEAFCSILEGQLPELNKPFKDVLSDLDAAILRFEPSIQQGALNKCHGDWYEWLIAAKAWNYRIEHKKNKILLLLPNVRSLNVSSMYINRLHQYIVDLKEKVSAATNAQLISSNPDFIIIDTQGIKLDQKFSDPITKFTPSDIAQLEDTHKDFVGLCELDNVCGYLSVKTSLRPDRRLQISHEGSLMKAMYIHLQTRDWILQPKGLLYYAATTKASDADIIGLKTIATHSITTVQSLPQAAVDEVFIINSLADTDTACAILLI